jgi:hypothetical protein
VKNNRTTKMVSRPLRDDGRDHTRTKWKNTSSSCTKTSCKKTTCFFHFVRVWKTTWRQWVSVWSVVSHSLPSLELYFAWTAVNAQTTMIVLKQDHSGLKTCPITSISSKRSHGPVGSILRSEQWNHSKQILFSRSKF